MFAYIFQRCVDNTPKCVQAFGDVCVGGGGGGGGEVRSGGNGLGGREDATTIDGIDGPIKRGEKKHE